MSLHLVSQSLDLDLEREKNDQEKNQKSKSRKIVSKAQDKMNITTNRQGLKRQLNKVQLHQKKKAAEKKKKRKLKSEIEKYQEANGQDHTQSNVEALLRITDLGKVSKDISEKILYQHPCRLSRDVKEQSKKEEESSLFSEEDFQKFAREYKPSS